MHFVDWSTKLSPQKQDLSQTGFFLTAAYKFEFYITEARLNLECLNNWYQLNKGGKGGKALT